MEQIEGLLGQLPGLLAGTPVTGRVNRQVQRLGGTRIVGRLVDPRDGLRRQVIGTRLRSDLFDLLYGRPALGRTEKPRIRLVKTGHGQHRMIAGIGVKRRAAAR